jgi:hypothetical protein
MRKRNIILSAIVITVMLGAVLGGTLARFVDTEEEVGDTVSLGSMDLQVMLNSGFNGFMDDTLVAGGDPADPADWSIETFLLDELKPEKSKHVSKTVRNVGTVDGVLYIHIKNVTHLEADDKEVFDDAGNLLYVHHPEPETVCEKGGYVGQVLVDPWAYDNIGHHIAFTLKWDGTDVDLSDYESGTDPGWISLMEVECEEIMLGTVEKCRVPTHEIELGFMFHDLIDPDWQDEHPDEYSRLEWWPSNCYMGDKAEFDILYILIDPVEA